MGQIKNLTIILVILLSSMAYIGIAFAETEQDLIINIKIAPATLNLNLDKPSVTVHANIAYSEVDEVDYDTLKLGGIPASYMFADDCGNLVAKFNKTDVNAIVATPEATLTLTGETNDGDSFTGSDTVRVIDPPSK